MLSDITSPFYNYIRGAILILAIFHFINYTLYHKKMYLYYSGYFICLSIFFFGENIPNYETRKIYANFYSSIHLVSYSFYIGFARELLHTRIKLPKWDKYLSYMQWFLVFGGLSLIGLGYLLAGKKGENIVFFTISPVVTIFSIIVLYRFYKLKTTQSKYFVLGSSIFIIMANLSLLSQVIFGLKNFLNTFYFRAILFTYIGALLEAIIFAFLIGELMRNLELKERKKEKELKKVKGKQKLMNKKITSLKKLVTKNHIVLKNKSKITLNELIYIHSEGHYLKLYTFTNQEFIRGKISEIKKDLPPNFIQTHRSYIVNFNYIKNVSSNFIVMSNKVEIPISRSKKKIVKNELLEYQKSKMK